MNFLSYRIISIIFTAQFTTHNHSKLCLTWFGWTNFQRISICCPTVHIKRAMLWDYGTLSLQTCMLSHPVGLDVWFLVGLFIYFHTSCVRTAKARVRLRRCAGSPEPSLVAYVISTIISWAGSNIAMTNSFTWIPYTLCAKTIHSGGKLLWSISFDLRNKRIFYYTLSPLILFSIILISMGSVMTL